jgi:hypothetical protein
MHSSRDQLRRALQQYSFPALTRNAEYERLPGQHRQRGGGTDYLFCSGSLRMISFGREVLPHSYLADTGPD